MIKEGEVIFNNNSSLNLNLFLENYPSIPISSEEYEEIAVEGRNGNLIVNKGTYKDKKITFKFTFLSAQLETEFDEVYQWLDEVEDDNKLFWGRDDRYYTVKKVVFGDLQKEFRNMGAFNVTFICEPFSKDVEEQNVAITNNNKTLTYEGTVEPDTLITIDGTGEILLSINGQDMTISNVVGGVVIDSRLMQVRDKQGNSKDLDATGEFVKLRKGLNFFYYEGQITSINVNYTNTYK